jgi:phospholipid-binding lipoprotein MlaA
MLAVKKCFFVVLLITLTMPLMAESIEQHEPFDPVWLDKTNKAFFKFNEGVDRLVLKPVAIVYDSVVPGVVQIGADNVFENLQEIRTMVNSALQGDPKNLGRSLLRFTANSTLGFVGVFDVATKMGITANEEDFGQTLAKWGFPQGKYIMLPLIGPSSARDIIAMIPDGYLNPLSYTKDPLPLVGRSLDVINTRAKYLDVDHLMIGDRYQFVKDVYLLKRHKEIHNMSDQVADDVVDDDF